MTAGRPDPGTGPTVGLRESPQPGRTTMDDDRRRVIGGLAEYRQRPFLDLGPWENLKRDLRFHWFMCGQFSTGDEFDLPGPIVPMRD